MITILASLQVPSGMVFVILIQVLHPHTIQLIMINIMHYIVYHIYLVNRCTSNSGKIDFEVMGINFVFQYEVVVSCCIDYHTLVINPAAFNQVNMVTLIM